jgi:multiple sugar transport system permease protein
VKSPIDVTRRRASGADGMTTRRESLAGGLLALPGTFLLLSLLIVPALVVLPVAFTDWEFGRGRIALIGWRNFLELAEDPRFAAALRNTIAYVVMVVPATVGLALFLALLIDGSGRLKTFYRTAHFLPVVSTLAAMAVAWDAVLHPTFGLLNQLLELVGIPGRSWLREDGLVLPALAVIGVWHNLGFAVIMFLAGLRSIPNALLDAAALDGATAPLDKARVVILPLLGPITVFITVLTAKKALAAFDTVWVMTGGGPDNASEVLLHFLYIESFEHLRAGYGAAVSVVYLLLVTAVMLGQRAIDRRIRYP